MDPREPRARDDVVGDDRDSESILHSLSQGVSIVLVGPLGSGKSHFIRHLIERLTARGEPPLVLRSGGPLSAVPHGALEASPDPRAARLREGRNGEDGRPIVVIDDAHELDPATVATVVRAVYGGHATALFALTVSRDGSTKPMDGNPDAAQMAVDLWLRGLADRVDLAALTPRDADHLLDLFSAPELDTLTRATIVALADGSRMLLRELAAEAAHALRQGRDPIESLRDSAPHGRLSDALAAHIRQLGASERTTLAVLGRVPHIARADAARFLPSAVVDGLIATRLVRDDSTPAHRLTANAALAREADRRAGSDGVDAVLDGAVTRMLAPSSEWWCEPLALLAAQSWLHGSSLGPDYDEVPPSLRARATLHAARRANDAGEPVLANAYAQLGLRSQDSPELMLEIAYAEAVQGSPVDIDAVVTRLGAQPVDTATLLRCVRIASLIGGSDAAAVREATERFAALSCLDPRAASELAFTRTRFYGSSMDWLSAAASAQDLYVEPKASVSLRMRAAAFAGLAHACLGSWEEGQAWFLRAHRCAGERGGLSPVSTAERLWVVSLEIMAGAMTGTDVSSALARLGGEVDAAAREGDPETTAIAGLVLACAYTAVGDAEQAHRELGAAVRRARPPVAAGWVPLAQIAVTRALALHGHGERAQTVLQQLDPAALEGTPALAHARLVAETYVSTALGRRAEALRAAQAAVLASVNAPTLRVRDLYQVAALGQTREALPEMRRLAEDSDVPATRYLAEMATSLIDALDPDGPSPVDALRLGAAWDAPEEEGLGLGVTRSSGLTHTPAAELDRFGPIDLELTRREREIALLVAEGLGNREIAERLYLSVRTVESHVYQARAKLGARSRAELGRTVAPAARAVGEERARAH